MSSRIIKQRGPWWMRWALAVYGIMFHGCILVPFRLVVVQDRDQILEEIEATLKALTMSTDWDDTDNTDDWCPECVLGPPPYSQKCSDCDTRRKWMSDA